MEPEYGYQGAKGNVSAPKEEKVLFKTTFTNTTQREQEYSFKTERCTRSTSTVIIEKGVCRGMEVALKLKTPCEVVEANAGFHQEHSRVKKQEKYGRISEYSCESTVPLNLNEQCQAGGGGGCTANAKMETNSVTKTGMITYSNPSSTQLDDEKNEKIPMRKNYAGVWTAVYEFHLRVRL
ncbi:hypothetical protein ANCCAN_25879 [Ancylostoma caninum]|uniref:Uncharacterized protein n=1 Tax=Ancylostoma caninum TaxID=29170 RepID=A0A368FBJ3_ANCCA|nr:hypothetical protein ANCCAN_25879 [Ancylostoma caninum]